MTPVALFLVKNGIGYGHIRRALVVATDLAARGELRPIVVSQARTLDLLRTSIVSVLNLPLLHRVPSAVGEDAYLDVLERVIERLAPAVVVEDTYPDQRYGSLRALGGVPRVLLLRRLDGESFDTLRSRGAFAPYDRILLAQDPRDIEGEGHSGESLFALRHSNRVVGVGNIHRVPTRDEIDTERRRHRGPLVVVNGGAGGDQLHNGYGHRLLAAAHRTAAALHAENHPARFVIVTGPYYAGPPLPELPNLIVHRFTPTLPALLAAADVAVIKPGNNALADALQGGGHLVHVPDASFMEGTHANARRVVERYGGAVVGDGDDGAIDDAVRAALAHTAPRSRRPQSPANAIRAAADTITATATTRPIVGRREVGIAVRTCDPGPRLPSWATAVRSLTSDATPSGPVALLDSPPRRLTPQEVVNRGISVLVSAGPPSGSAERWLRLAPPRPALPLVEAGLVATGPHDSPDRVLHALARALAEPTHRVVVLDLRRLDLARTHQTISQITGWITDQAVDAVPLDRLIGDTATRLLHGSAP